MGSRKMTVVGLLAAMLLLGGCLGRDAEIYGEKEVLEYVDSICEEPYELVSKELIEREPDNMEYTFQTKGRGLKFTANSTLNQIQIDASYTAFYRRAIECDYVLAVHELYADELKRVLSECGRYAGSGGLDFFYVIEFADIEEVVDGMMKADEVYRQELAYNSEQFLLEYPLRSVQLVWNRSKQEALEHRNWVHITNIPVTGLHDGEALYEELAEKYAQLYVDGKIEEGHAVPAKYLENLHVSTLSEIELDGIEMLYELDASNPYGTFGLTTEDYNYCWYSPEAEAYMVVSDIGWVTDSSSFPMIVREYVTALGGSYEVEKQEDLYTSSWSIGEDVWEMESVYSDNEIKSLEIAKNGEPLEIPYITVQEDHNVKATFCVGIRAEDFCRLFDLSYEIDEENGRLLFSSGRTKIV